LPSDKRARQKSYRQAKLAAEAAARRRRQRRRQLTFLGIVAATIAVTVLIVSLTGDDEGQDVASGGTTTTAAGASAAGKPCVPLADPLPPGAPEVPVIVGPPPAQLVIDDLREGDGAVIESSNTLTVNYIGVSCSTGRIFDSSYARGQAATFPLSGVIPGWQIGLPGMKVGGQRLLGIPSDLAYGPAGSPPNIAPDEALWFVVDVVSAT
jgi:peptidylprolyl isomerase